jgi:serine/threonine protein kinase
MSGTSNEKISTGHNFPYEKLERVGKGSFGEVYKGINLETQKLVAIKIVDLDVEYEPEEFQAELSLLSHCSCPHIVQYYGAFLRGTSLWIIMDYCGGGSVREAVGYEFATYYLIIDGFFL